MANKLNDIQKTYIQAKASTMTPRALAKKLGVDEKVVATYISRLQKDDALEQTTAEVEEITAESLYHKPMQGVVVASQATSERADASRETSVVPDSRYKGAIQPARRTK